MSVDSLNSSELAQLRSLLDLEAIRKIKRQYAHFMDAGEIRALADLFTEDGVCEFGPYGTWHGRETIFENYLQVSDSLVEGLEPASHGAMHCVTNHEVELLGEGQAKGRSYLIDVLTTVPKDGQPLLWFALYDERYQKVGDDWKISHCRIQFMWPERHVDGELLSTLFAQ